MAESNELLKKLSQIKRDIMQPVLGDVSLDPKQIIDFTVAVLKDYAYLTPTTVGLRHGEVYDLFRV